MRPSTSNNRMNLTALRAARYPDRYPDMKRTITSILSAAFIVAMASRAQAEVMDKEASLPAIWTFALAGGACSLILWRVRWWAGIAALVPAALFLSGVYAELRDPYVGPAILLEAGPGYERSFWLAVGAVAVCQIIGATYWLWTKRRAASRIT